MKLYYYQFRDKVSNFGDDLNPWLWEQLLPGVFDEDTTTLFVGIGTLLNEYVPKVPKTVVFGSGFGYGKGVPKIHDSWKIYCVRGPLTAKALGIATELAVTDAALLVRRVYQPTATKVNRFAYIPHVTNAIRGDITWRLICEQAGIAYIDPRWSIEHVLSAISETEVVLAEAMHGAIVADALRVPWIPICTESTVLPFKWQDWCLSIGVEYQPKYVMPFRGLYPPGPGVRSSLRHWLNWVKQNPSQIVPKIGEDESKQVAIQLARIAKTSQPMLSNQNRIEQLTVELEERLQQFRKDTANGYFRPNTAQLCSNVIY
ncbi:MAG: polysaccharide pyruvyl transferase family protein [Coleofasciculus sp. S288]|nr:polysaccharide pyruvyl transferase family protein [Coleofasciculus sp. S288]